MKPLEIVNTLQDIFKGEIKEISEFNGQVSVIVARERIIEIIRYLHDSPELDFDHLQDICGVDYMNKKPIRFEVVYQLFSITQEHSIRIRAEVPEEDPSIETLSNIWEGAGWHERECYDMFGIIFKGHKDLRRILMPEDWNGHPLRKDYPLEGYGEFWQGFKDVLTKAEEHKKFETKKLD